MVTVLYTDPHGMGAPTAITVADDVAELLLVNEAFRRADAPAESAPPVPSPETIATET